MQTMQTLIRRCNLRRLGLHRLPMSRLWDARDKWVNQLFFILVTALAHLDCDCLITAKMLVLKTLNIQSFLGLTDSRNFIFFCYIFIYLFVPLVLQF